MLLQGVELLRLVCRRRLLLESAQAACCSCSRLRSRFHCVSSRAADRTLRLLRMSSNLCLASSIVIVQKAFLLVDATIARGEVAGSVVSEARGLVVLELGVNDRADISVVLADDARVDLFHSSTHQEVYCVVLFVTVDLI